MAALVALGGLTAVGVAVAMWAAEPLPASVSPFAFVPLLLLGLYVAVGATWIRDQGLYGALFARLPPWGHLGMCAVGCALVGGSLVGLGKLPPAAALEAERLGAGLDRFCTGPAEARVERELLPALERLLEIRPALRGSARDALDVRVRALGARCLPAVREAFEDARGAHVSWGRLRDALGAESDLRPSPDDPVWSAPFREAGGTSGGGSRPVVLDVGGGQ